MKTDSKLDSKYHTDIDPSWSTNKFILNWWKDEFDEYLVSLVDKYHWLWEGYFNLDYILTKIDNNIIKYWQSSDPLCQKYAWYNILCGFCRSRLFCKGILKRIRKAEVFNCALCKEDFIETSIWYSRAKRMTIEQLDFCDQCASLFMFGDLARKLTAKESSALIDFSFKQPTDLKLIAALKNDSSDYLSKLFQSINRIPMNNFGKNFQDYHGISTKNRLAIYHLFLNRPPHKVIVQIYGSWIAALIEANILENGAIKTERGIRCLAHDGHECNSIGEKTIDDFLFSYGIAHKKEPNYPEGNYRGDFLIGQTMVEYFGLAGEKSYDEKIKLKRQICKNVGIELIEIFPSDLTKPAFLSRCFEKYITINVK
jgi:hypothetical protein